ncbi:MAG: ABC transporter permease subunit [Thalassospira sp.]|nr:ABC transporter permease subunit [Thalassospira sp.]MDP2697057.1 ABC transporter permease subunit [Thalassospira sp.]
MTVKNTTPRSRGFYAQLVLTLLLCLFILVPIVMSMLAGVTVNVFQGLKSGLTLRWVGEVWMLYSDSILLSVWLALACLAVTLVVGVPLAYVLVRCPGRLSRLFEELLTLPVAIPGLALALALLITYGGFPGYRTSPLFILTGHVLFTLPFMVRSVSAILSAIDLRALEEGAASLGARFWRRFFTVILPNARPGILAGSLMVVTLSIGEFNLTWMLHTPLTKTLPVGLADSYASMRLEIGSAYTLIFFVLIMPLLIAMQVLANWQKPDPRKTVTDDKDMS